MGSIRSVPQNQVNTLSNDQLKHYAVTGSCCGWQHFMEDYQVSEQMGFIYLYAVIDGHNGPEVAKFCYQNLPHLFKNNQLIKMGQLLSGAQCILNQLDQLVTKSQKSLNQLRIEQGLPALPENQPSRSGCSITLALFNNDDLVIANIGQCRCYIVYDKDRSRAVLFSGNHTTSNKDEENRILKSNGFIHNGRVNGMYPYTRSIGDLHLRGKQKQKRLISCQPTVFSLRKEDIFQIILGSSGTWERPQKITKHINTMGKSCREDIQKLQTLLSSLVAKQPSQDRMGLQNIMLTLIRFKH